MKRQPRVRLKCDTCGKTVLRSVSIVREKVFCGRPCFLKSQMHKRFMGKGRKANESK